MKIKWLFLSLIPLLYPLERFCHKQTDGFALVNIASHQKQLGFSQPLSHEARAALNQRFTYLGCGAQCYVFSSSDGRYVLKFFKQHHLRIPPWMESLWLPQKGQALRAQKILKKESERKALFSSIEIAETYLKEQTGLIYTHLCPSDDLHQMVTLVDKLGIAHELSLDHYEFYLQKKAELAYDFLKQSPEKASEAISQLVALTRKRIAMNIFDKDPDFSTNFGFAEGRAIQIDLGRFSLPENDLDQKSELERVIAPLRNWLFKENHQLVSSLDEAIKKECVTL